MHEKLTAQDLEDTAFATDVFKNDRAPTYRGLSTRVCPVCGKEFIPAGQHMYRTNIRGKSVCNALIHAGVQSLRMLIFVPRLISE